MAQEQDLQARLEGALAAAAGATAEAEAAKKLLLEQAERIETLEAAKDLALPVVKHGKDKYQFTAAQFQLGGVGEVTEAKNATKDQIKQLVEMGAGVLEKIDS